MELDFNIDKDLKQLLKLTIKLYQRESRITDYGSSQLFLLLISFFASCKLSDIEVEKDYLIEEPSLYAISQLFEVITDNIDEEEIHRGTLKELDPILKQVLGIMKNSEHENCDVYDFLYALYIINPEEFKSALKAFPDMKTSWHFQKSETYRLMLGRSIPIMQKIIENYDDETTEFLGSLNAMGHEAEDVLACMFEDEIAEKKENYPAVALAFALANNPRYRKILEDDRLDLTELRYILEDYGFEDSAENTPQYLSNMLQDVLSNTLYLCDDMNNITLDEFVKVFFKKYPKQVKEVFEDILFVDTFYDTKISREILSDKNSQEEVLPNLKEELEDYEDDMETLLDYGEFLDEKEYQRKPALGREKEMKKAIITLLTPEKSVMLIGDAGVGKTAIVEGIASKIKEGRIPKQLKGMKILKVTTSKLVEGCKYVGTFEEKMEELFGVLKKYPNIILNIDEIHTAIGLGQGSHGNLDFANILKPYLDRGAVRLITSTTEEEYDKIVKEDEAFRRRFERITVKEPEKETLFKILNQKLEDLVDIYKISFPYSIDDRDLILNEIVDLTQKSHRVYNDNQNNPDLSLSILAKSFAYAAYDSKEQLEVTDIISSIEDCDRIYATAKSTTINRIKNCKKSESDDKKNKVIKLEFE